MSMEQKVFIESLLEKGLPQNFHFWTLLEGCMLFSGLKRILQPWAFWILLKSNDSGKRSAVKLWKKGCLSLFPEKVDISDRRRRTVRKLVFPQNLVLGSSKTGVFAHKFWYFAVWIFCSNVSRQSSMADEQHLRLFVFGLHGEVNVMIGQRRASIKQSRKCDQIPAKLVTFPSASAVPYLSLNSVFYFSVLVCEHSWGWRKCH